MDNSDLRPMSLGEVLDRTFSLYRNHFWLFAGIMSLPLLLLLIFQTGMTALQYAGVNAATAGRAPGAGAVRRVRN